MLLIVMDVDQNMPPIVDTVLTSSMHLLDRLNLGHIKGLNVGVINIESASGVQRGLGYGAGQMHTMSLPLVSLNHGNTGDCPVRRGGSIPLTLSLSFLATG